MTYGDSACDSGAAMAISGRRRLFHETTGLVRIASFYVFAPWRLCVEFPSDFRRKERNVAEGQRRNVTKGCCLVSRFNEPSAGRRKLCFLPVSRVLQWRSQAYQQCSRKRRRNVASSVSVPGVLPFCSAATDSPEPHPAPRPRPATVRATHRCPRRGTRHGA